MALHSALLKSNADASLLCAIETLISETDFSLLYNKKRNLFSVGYSLREEALSNSYYDLLASEARQTSFVAIMLGAVPKKHWFATGRSLSVFIGYGGLYSWTGTAFEYFYAEPYYAGGCQFHDL
jgi:hypothetical protein